MLGCGLNETPGAEVVKAKVVWGLSAMRAGDSRDSAGQLLRRRRASAAERCSDAPGGRRSQNWRRVARVVQRVRDLACLR
jgi:hypothetical protein